jgi:beta-lactamase class C
VNRTIRIWILILLTVVPLVSALIWYAGTQREPVISDKEREVPPARTPLINPIEEELINLISVHIDSIRSKRDIPAIAVAIVRNGQPIYVHAFGDKKNNANDPVDIHTKFRLASVSKGFSAILATKMDHEDLISLDDPVGNYLPEFRPEPLAYSDSMLISNIISQTSGFPYQAYSNLIEDGWTLPEMINALGMLQVSSKPGRIYSYQNVAYSLIEPILESKTGEKFSELLERELFRPLGMENTSAEFEDMNTSNNAASPHRRTRYSYVPVRLSPSYYNTAAAGGIHSSISDMAKYLQMLTGHRPDVVDSTILDEVFSPRVRTPVLNRYYRRILGVRRAYYGLGWRIVPTKTDTIVYHGGYANGFKSHIALDRNDDVAICILSNSSDNLVNEAGPYFFNLYYELRDEMNAWDRADGQAR